MEGLPLSDLYVTVWGSMGGEKQEVMYALQVHVQPQEEVGVRDVAALDNVLHVPHFAVERPAHLSKARSQLPDLAARIARVLVGDAAKEEKPGTLQLRDGAQQATWIRKVVI